MAGVGIYASMKFPPYRFQEYPKAVTAKDGTVRRVNNQREEMAVEAEPAPEAGAVTASLEAQLADAQKRAREAEAALAALQAKNMLGHAGEIKPTVGPVGTDKAQTKPKA